MADEETKPPASITNIYYDCLERIFDFLDLESLLNVANTCKRLQIAAAAKFSDEYGQKIIVMTQVGRQNEIHVKSNSIHVAGLKFQLPFLRCFGSKISHLNFLSFYKSEEKTIVWQYIHQYCSGTLTGLSTWRNPVFPAEKPFKNLEKLEIVRGNLGVEFSNFANWYPNLRNLTLRSPKISKDFIAVNLPQFEHLGTEMGQWSMKYFADLLNANLQLQSLDIWVNDFDAATTSLTTVLNMIRAHHSISKLKVSVSVDSFIRVSAVELSQLVKEHPSITELDLEEYQFTVDDAVVFIRQLRSLKKFEFCVQNESEYDRIRDQLDDGWQCEHQRVERLTAAYIVKLNRKNEKPSES